MSHPDLPLSILPASPMKTDTKNSVRRDQLTTLFAKLGARRPESWAASQVDEDIPQLHRFLFLRQAWRLVVDENDPSWIIQRMAEAEERPDDPYTGAGHALRALRAKGATNEELTELVRGMQAELLFGFCHLLEDPGDVEEEVRNVTWALMQVDDDGSFVGSIDGLHESVLETDPTGREVRPRGSVGHFIP